MISKDSLLDIVRKCNAIALEEIENNIEFTDFLGEKLVECAMNGRMEITPSEMNHFDVKDKKLVLKYLNKNGYEAYVPGNYIDPPIVAIWTV